MSKKIKPTKAAQQQNISPVVKPTSINYSIALAWIVLSVVVLITLYIRIRWLDFPLERDEGEYAIFGQLILKGVPPYMEAYNMKLPGTYFMYALIMKIFGQTTSGIHIGLALVSMVSAVFMFFIVRKVADVFTAIVATAGLLVLSTSPTILGFAGHATHFIMLFALAGIWLVQLGLEKGKLWLLFAAGFALGVSFLMKQSGGVFIAFGLWLVFVHDLKSKPVNYVQMLLKLFVTGIASVLPFVAVVLLMKSVGAFDKFWFWSFTYLSKYGTQVGYDEAKYLLNFYMPLVTKGYLLFWVAAGLGVIALFLSRSFKEMRLFLLPLLLLSIISVSAGFYFRNHYFVVLFPALALSAAVALSYLKDLLKPYTGAAGYISVLIFMGLVMIGYITHKDYYFSEDLSTLSKKTYGSNPFVESIPIGDIIKSKTKPEDRVLVFGSEPQLYFYADRKPATGYIYTYAMMEPQPYAKTMQEEMATEVEKSKPEVIVVVKMVQLSWSKRPTSEEYIFGWFNKYLQGNPYELIATVDITNGMNSEYFLDENARQHKSQGENYINIYKRKN